MKGLTKKLLAFVLAFALAFTLMPAGSAYAAKKVVVKTRAQLIAALNDPKVTKIEIAPKAKKALTVPEGNYAGKTLVVNSPKVSVTNKGSFKAIAVKAAKTVTEKAADNVIKVTAPTAKLVVGEKATGTTIALNKKNADIEIVANGEVKNIEVNKTANVAVRGNTYDEVPVAINAKNVDISLAVPSQVDAAQNANITFEAGSEGSNVTAASEDVKLEIANATEDSVTVTDASGNESAVEGGTIVSDAAGEKPVVSEYTVEDEKVALGGADEILGNNDAQENNNSTSGGAGGGASYVPYVPVDTTPRLTAMSINGTPIAGYSYSASENAVRVPLTDTVVGLIRRNNTYTYERNSYLTSDPATVIYTIEDVRQFKNMLSLGTGNTSVMRTSENLGLNFEFVRDITIAETYTPAGFFNGNLNGNNHVLSGTSNSTNGECGIADTIAGVSTIVKNLYISDYASEDKGLVPLFWESVCTQDMTFDNVIANEINVTSTIVDKNQSPFMISTRAPKTYFKDCTNKMKYYNNSAEQWSSAFLGGQVGAQNGLEKDVYFDGCVFEGELYVTWAGLFVGNRSGANKARIHVDTRGVTNTACANRGTIVGYKSGISAFGSVSFNQKFINEKELTGLESRFNLTSAAKTNVSVAVTDNEITVTNINSQNTYKVSCSIPFYYYKENGEQILRHSLEVACEEQSSSNASYVAKTVRFRIKGADEDVSSLPQVAGGDGGIVCRRDSDNMIVVDFTNYHENSLDNYTNTTVRLGDSITVSVKEFVTRVNDKSETFLETIGVTNASHSNTITRS